MWKSYIVFVLGSNILQPISGGKPVQLTGKAMQTTKGILQIDGKAHPSVNVIQTAQGGLSTINIIPQGGNATVVSLSEAAQTTKSNSSTGQYLHSLFFISKIILLLINFRVVFST